MTVTPIKDLIRKIRITIHDEDKINYDDQDILNVINAGMRFIRRTIAEIQPEIIMTTTAGILQAGENEIKLKNIPLKIIELTAGSKVISTSKYNDGKKIYSNDDKIFGNVDNAYSIKEKKIFEESPLEEVTLQQISKRQISGKPRKFYRMGLKVLQIYPTPEKETAYTLRTVDDIKELKYEDETPFLSEFDDFLAEYAVIRLSLTNEYDMTQEQQILSNIHAQISQILSPPPASAVMKSYW